MTHYWMLVWPYPITGDQWEFGQGSLYPLCKSRSFNMATLFRLVAVSPTSVSKMHNELRSIPESGSRNAEMTDLCWISQTWEMFHLKKIVADFWECNHPNGSLAKNVLLASFWVARWCVFSCYRFFSLNVHLQWHLCQPLGGGHFATRERSKASYGHHRPKVRPLLQSRPPPPLSNLFAWCCWPHCVTWVKKLRKCDELVALGTTKHCPVFKGFHWWRFKVICIDTLACWEQDLGTFFSWTDDIVLLFASPFWNIRQFTQLGGNNWHYTPPPTICQSAGGWLHLLE